MTNAAPNPAPANRWPPQIKYILGNEAAERFSFYGMRGILTLYMTGALLLSKDKATEVAHWFVFTVYFMPVVGAWVSDRFWGRYKTILWISLFYCGGHGVLALSDFIPTIEGKIWCLYAGLALISFGSGGIKPCVSAFMGDQFRPDQAHLLQKAYAAFYWSINFGSTASFLFIPWVRKEFGYSWAFGIPGLAMAFATFIFWRGTKHYVMVPPLSQTRSAGFLQVWWFALTHGAQRQPGQSFWEPARSRFTPAEVDAAQSVGPILSIFALVPVFWALFDQTFSTWVLQGELMEPFAIGSYKIGPEEMLSANPIMVMIFLPILTLGIYPRIGKWASPLRRMSLGMFLSGFSFVVVAWMQTRLDAGIQMSVLWQLLPYVIITSAEVLVSTTGLEFAFTQAAPSMKSTITGFWQLTVSFGNLLVIAITKLLADDGGSSAITPQRFLLYAGMTFVVAVFFALIASRYKYRDQPATPTAA